eukprot:UN24502
MERINAIGNAIVCSEADVVALQEVTMNILKLLWCSAWWQQGKWNCSLPTSKPVEAAYFTIIISKHKFVGKPSMITFPSSVMGRNLTTVDIKFENRIITVATVHLESPVGPWAGGRKDLFSPERKKQIQTAFRELEGRENVIFGGDMNWNDPTKHKTND